MVVNLVVKYKISTNAIQLMINCNFTTGSKGVVNYQNSINSIQLMVIQLILVNWW